MSATIIRRGLAIAGGTALLFVAVMGFAHTRPGRPLLGVMGRAFRGGGACPLGYDRKATPADRERARARFTAQYRGAHPAAGRPALGFDLDRTSRQDVVSFMKSRGVECLVSTPAADLVCEDVSALPAAASGEALKRTLWLNFGIKAQLISLIAFSRAPRAETISAAFTDVTGALERRAGPATRTVGNNDARSLSAGALRQASAEFRFADYYASARATNTGQDFLLIEEYRSLVN